MKISNVEAIHLRVEMPNGDLFDGSYDDCVIVVRTDDGIEGIGETESFSPAIQALVRGPSAHNRARGLKEVLMGRDPTDPEGLWQLMYEATEYVGRKGLVMHALGGIDLALWDIKGHVEGRPVHELLGGSRRWYLAAAAAYFVAGESWFLAGERGTVIISANRSKCAAIPRDVLEKKA